MKKGILLLSLILFTLLAQAQFSKLVDFQNKYVGTQPFGGLTFSVNHDTLFGMTNGGGAFGGGNIYSTHVGGYAFDTIHSFDMAFTSGSNPYGALTLSGGKLYGMTSGYGTYGHGNVFSMNPNGTGYTDLYDFTDSIGDAPNGSLVISGNIMYGTTTTRGDTAMGYGSVFSIHTDGTGVKKLVEFTGANGHMPCADLVLSGNVLYGMTSYGGLNGHGRIFSVHTDGSNFTSLYDFSNANITPIGSLSISGNRLFGCIGSAGLYNKGFIFSIGTNGSGFRDIFDFNGTNGQNPMGAPCIAGKTMYGTTCNGGANTYGTIYSIDTNGTNFNALYSFTNQDGEQARARLIKWGNTLYGTSVVGGAHGNGTVFKFTVSPLSVPICMVTSDDSSHHNMVIWQKQANMRIDSFFIYRETTSNTYKKIGAQPYSALSEFVDTVSAKYFPFSGNPNAGTYRYKLQARDSSGNYSLLSPYHNTLFVTQSGGTFNWNQYTVEGDSIPLPSISAYVLYRDDNSTGVWHQIVGVSGTQTTATDPNFSSFPNGSWRVETVWNITCTPTAKSYSSSKSNIKGKGLGSGIASYFLANPLSVFPNPATSSLSITGIKGETHIKLIDLLGKTVLEMNAQSTLILDISYLPEGVYTLVADCHNARAFQKVVVTK
jgi:uncharacterized repeat protein (TIGR03803 family)